MTSMLIGMTEVPVPEERVVSHVVPEDVVVLRHSDWLAIADAVAVAKVGNVLTATQRARLDGVQIVPLDYPDKAPVDGVSWGVDPQVGDKVGWTDTEYPAAGERTGVITEVGHDGWGRPRVYLAGDHNTFGTWLLVAAFNGVLHEEQTDIARIID